MSTKDAVKPFTYKDKTGKPLTAEVFDNDPKFVANPDLSAHKKLGAAIKKTAKAARARKSK